MAYLLDSHTLMTEQRNMNANLPQRQESLSVTDRKLIPAERCSEGNRPLYRATLVRLTELQCTRLTPVIAIDVDNTLWTHLSVDSNPPQWKQRCKLYASETL